MSDNGDSASVVASNTDKDKQENVPRVPHRPAPPIPAPKYKMTSSKQIHNTLIINITFTNSSMI